MELQGAFQSVWICFLLFSIGVCAPARKSPADAGYHAGGSHHRGGSGSSGGFASGFGTGSVGGAISGFGSGSGVGASAAQDAGLYQMIADLMGLSPYGSRPPMQSHWSASQVPLGMVATRPVYPSSLIVLTDSGYQRARDFRSDSKYTQDTFDNIPLPGTPQNPGSGSKGQQV